MSLLFMKIPSFDICSRDTTVFRFAGIKFSRIETEAFLKNYKP